MNMLKKLLIDSLRVLIKTIQFMALMLAIVICCGSFLLFFLSAFNFQVHMALFCLIVFVLSLYTIHINMGEQ